jgi:hypothetical protein
VGIFLQGIKSKEVEMKMLATVLLMGFFVAHAVAQDEGDEAFDPWKSPGQATETSTTSTTSATDADEATPEPQVVTPQNYPLAEIDRPFALPLNMFEMRGQMNLRFNRFASNLSGLEAGGGYGVVRNVEAGANLSMGLSPDVKMMLFRAYGLYDLSSVINSPQLFAAGRLSLDVALSQMTTHDFSVLLDAPVLYKINNQFALTGGVGLGLGLSESSVLIRFDYGVMYQVQSRFVLELASGVYSNPGLHDTDIPLFAQAQYTMLGDLDLFVKMGFPDLKDAKTDVFAVFLGACFRM